MRSVHIGVRHDDDLMIPELGDVKIFMYPCTERGYHSLDLRISIDPVKPCLLHVQYLSPERKDRLGCTVSRSLGRTAG